MRCRPRRWLWGLIPLTLPLLGAAFFSAPLLEQRLTGAAAAALRSAGVKWVNIEVDGRDARLSGEAPSAEAIRRAVQVVAGVHGIRLVESREVTLAARAIAVPPAGSDPRPTPTPALPPLAEEAPREPPSVADATPPPPTEPVVEVAPLPPPPVVEATPLAPEPAPPPVAEAAP